MTSTPTLRHWSIRNFKSIGEAELELSGLTLLVGRNSAGKSSVIQSLLLFAQSSDIETNGQLSLNGPLTSLGLFDDVVSRFAPEREIAFSGQFQLPVRRMGPPVSRRYGMGVKLSVPMGFEWKGTLVEDNHTGEARYGHGSFARLNSRAPLEIQFTSRSVEDSTTAAESERLGFGPYRVHVSSPRDPEGSDYEFAQFLAGVPVEGQRLWSPLEWWLRDIENDLNPHLGRAGSTQGFEDLTVDDEQFLRTIAERVADYIEVCIREERDDELAGQAEAPFHANIVVTLELRPREIALMTIKYTELRDEIRQLVRHRLGASADALEYRVDPGTPYERGFGINRAVEPWQQFWARRIKYLGPLREEPRPAYSRQRSNTAFAPLGLKGEFAASFLHDKQSTPYLVPMPDGEIRRVPLREALNAWLQHMHIANEVDVRADGRVGLEVRVDGRNVTSVGTGLSQLLPVLIVCLTAEPGTLTLIEQPEIHVEPGAQQLLAEFLLAIAQSGRQLLVETHSEYLITRLRLLTAQDPDKSEGFAIYFAEQESGRSAFRRVHIAPNGGIDDWPAGFFDQAAIDAQALMLQAVRSPSIRP